MRASRSGGGPGTDPNKFSVILLTDRDPRKRTPDFGKLQMSCKNISDRNTSNSTNEKNNKNHEHE